MKQSTTDIDALIKEIEAIDITQLPEDNLLSW